MTKPIRPIVAWRFAAALLLHLALPAYVISVAIVLLLAFQPVTISRSLGLALVTGAWFIPLYSGFIVAVAFGTRAADAVLRHRQVARASRDPATAARNSGNRVNGAVAAIERIATGTEPSAHRIRAAAALLRAGAWQHEEQAFQALSSDLASAVGAFAISFDTAGVSGKSDIRLMAASALEQIVGELRRLENATKRLDYGDAQVAARYIELRYGSTDFTGERRS